MRGASVARRAAPDVPLRSTAAERERSWKATGLVTLRDGQLREIPPAVYALGGGAKALDASNNRLALLPPAFASLCALQRLALSANALSAVPAACFAPGLSATLRVLLLDGNRLAEAPACLRGLARLERLSLRGNALSKLDGELLVSLSSLKVLDLAGNKLVVLPSELGGCTSLEELDLSGNALGALPAELGKLARLRSLNADGNRLTTLPPELLTGCLSLSSLQLHDQTPPLRLEALRELPGWDEVEKRTLGRNAKRVQGGVLIGSRGLDDGLDHDLARG